MKGVEYSLSHDALASYVAQQLDHAFPDDHCHRTTIRDVLPTALDRVAHCWRHINNKYFFDGSRVCFNHLHGDQWAMFLYLLSNSAHRCDVDRPLCSKLYLLNRMHAGIDLYYEVNLPDVFYLQHPVGSVIGRADYKDYLVIYQRVTVGANLDGACPEFGEGVVLFGNASVIGQSRVGSNVMVSGGAAVMDSDVPSNSLVFSGYPSPTIKPSKRSVAERFFRRGD